MRGLATFLAQMPTAGPAAQARAAAYLAATPEARPLLCGPAPRRLIAPATLRDWIAEHTGLPAPLIEASRKATGDLAEALALLLPPVGQGAEPALRTVLADLSDLPPGPLAKPAILHMAQRLPPDLRVLYFRLITGAWHPLAAAARPATGYADAPPYHPETRHTCLAVLLYAEAALATGARGPELTLAVWRDGIPVPVARARADLPAAQTAALMTWIRAHATGRFGPLRAVPATQVFQLGFASVTPNRRRSSGITLTDPTIIAWHPDRDPADAAQLASLTALLANTA